MNFRKFIFYSTLGIIPWTMVLIYFGIVLGSAWETIIKKFDELQILVVIGLVIFVIWWILKDFKERKKQSVTA